MSNANQLEWQMLGLINSERAALGLNPLRMETRLNDSSEDHSAWMLQSDVFSHTGINGSNPGDRMRAADFTFSGSWGYAENIAWRSERGLPGASDDVIVLHEGLMNSPGHRANILNPSYEVIGIGIEIGNFNGYDAVMVTQNFARTSAPVHLDGQGGSGGGNSAPDILADDIVLGKLKGARQTKLEKHITTHDADGDDVVWYELLDTAGRDNFRFKGQGKIDADMPFRVAADDLDMIRVRVDGRPGESTLAIRAFDGETVGDWEEFTLTTLSADDWHILN